MFKNPKVSIVIPVYNGANYLNEAIDSALAQTYQNIEIIVVNDGSNDNGQTEKIALSYDDKISYFSKPNGGVASALNTAISKMTGEYFSWLSHDDLYYPNKIEVQINKLNELNIFDCVLYSDFTIFNIDLNRIYPSKIESFNDQHFRYKLTTASFLHGCTLLIAKKAFDKCGLFNEKLRTTQDYDMWFRIAEKYQFIHIPELLIKSRTHSEQDSVKLSSVAFEECNELLIKFINNLRLEEITKATGKDKVSSYIEIAKIMWIRGYNKAGERAYALARKYGAPNKSLELIKKNIKFKIKNWLFRTAKNILPSKMRVVAKQILYKYRSAQKSNLNLNLNNSSAAETDNNIINEDLVFKGDIREKFTKVCKENIFGGSISRSGEGSDLKQTQIIRQELPEIVKKFNVKTFLDAPCGDYYWMQNVNLNVDEYIGIDIVDDLIKLNNSKHGNDKVVFYTKNLANDPLPKADLIFSRDCHVHLNFKDALNMIANFKNSGATYLLITTFENRTSNKDFTREDDFWRPLNMNLPPFNFPKPLLLINEGCSEKANNFSDKCLGLWLLDDIKINNIA